MNRKSLIFLMILAGLLFVEIGAIEAQSNFVFTKILRRGNTGIEVRKLQEVLAAMPDVYPEKLITSYFGLLTQQAIRRFQVKYNIISSGDENTTGYGQVGPKTRAKLNELASSQASESTSLSTNQGTTKIEKKINPALCPDNIWDEAEQKDPTLCPEDNPINNPKSTVAKITPKASSSPQVSTSTHMQIGSTTTPAQTPTPVIAFKWTKDSGIRISGAQVPYAYRLNDGRYRLYYCGLSGNIMSAISSDGLNFQEEAGARLAPIYGGYETIICDPTLIELSDGRFRLYYKGANKGGVPAIHKIFSAISSDGLSFEREGVVIDSEKTDDKGWASVPEAIKLSDGRIRIYYVSGSSRGIVSAISSDGLNFIKEETHLFDYVDPSIIRLSDGNFLFAAPLFQNGISAGIYSFISSDGIHFDTANPQPVLVETAVGDQTIVKIDDKTYRMFYWNLQDSSPIIYSITGTIDGQ